MSALRVLANHCLSEIKIPERVNSAHAVNYNAVFGLHATASCYHRRVFIWKPVTEEVVASFSTTFDSFCGAIFFSTRGPR